MFMRSSSNACLTPRGTWKLKSEILMIKRSFGPSEFCLCLSQGCWKPDNSLQIFVAPFLENVGEPCWLDSTHNAMDTSSIENWENESEVPSIFYSSLSTDSEMGSSSLSDSWSESSSLESSSLSASPLVKRKECSHCHCCYQCQHYSHNQDQGCYCRYCHCRYWWLKDQQSHHLWNWWDSVVPMRRQSCDQWRLIQVVAM